MSLIFQRYYKKIFFRWIVLPAIFFNICIFILLSNIIFFDISPSVISYRHKNNVDFVSNFQNIENGEELTGKFTAAEDNLGIISLQFNSEPPIKDTLQFSLFDESGVQISYNEYDISGFYDLHEFPFGFDIIEKSKGNNYKFKIVFIAQNKVIQNTLKIVEPDLITKYKFDKSDILSDQKSLFYFISKKISYTFLMHDQVKYYTLYFLPLFALLFFNTLYDSHIMSRNKIRLLIESIKRIKIISKVLNNTPHSYYYIAFTHLLYILFFPLNLTIFSLLLIMSWLVYLHKNKLSSTSTFYHIAVISLLLPILIPFQFSNITIKLLSLIFLYLVIALTQSIIEIKLYDTKK